MLQNAPYEDSEVRAAKRFAFVIFFLAMQPAVMVAQHPRDMNDERADQWEWEQRRWEWEERERTKQGPPRGGRRENPAERIFSWLFGGVILLVITTAIISFLRQAPQQPERARKNPNNQPPSLYVRTKRREKVDEQQRGEELKSEPRENPGPPPHARSQMDQTGLLLATSAPPRGTLADEAEALRGSLEWLGIGPRQVVQSFTNLGPGHAYSAEDLRQIARFLRSEFNKLQRETLEDFLRKNSEPHLVAPPLTLEGQLTPISDEELGTLRDDESWRRFENAHPATRRVVGISRVGFNSELTQALAYAGIHSAHGEYFLLKSRSYGWQVKDSTLAWAFMTAEDRDALERNAET